MPLHQKILGGLERTFPSSSTRRSMEIEDLLAARLAFERQRPPGLKGQALEALMQQGRSEREQGIAASFGAQAPFPQDPDLSLLAGFPRETLEILGDIRAKKPAPKAIEKLTPLEKIQQGRLLLNKHRGAGVNLLNSGLADSGSTYRIPKDTKPQVGKGLADLFIAYNDATEDIDFDLPTSAPVLDKIESGLLKNLVQSESFQRATPAGQTDIAKAADKFFQAKRKMRQKNLSVREGILQDVIDGKELKGGKKRVYEEIIKRRDLLSPEDIENRTIARLRAYREERKKAIEANDLDGLASLISSAEEKLMGRSDPEVVEGLVWATFEAHYRTKRKQDISEDEFDRKVDELINKFEYDAETAVRLVRFRFKVIQ